MSNLLANLISLPNYNNVGFFFFKLTIATLVIIRPTFSHYSYYFIVSGIHNYYSYFTACIHQIDYPTVIKARAYTFTPT